MRKQLLRTLAFALAPAALLLPAPAQTATPIPQLDTTHMPGTWYEIARLPIKREGPKKCVSDVFDVIAPADKPGRLQIVESCKAPKGYTNISNFTARRQNKKDTTSGALKISTIWPLSRKYWVLALDPGYAWSLIGTPNHKNLWIYSKTQTLSPETLTDLKARATAQGFDTGKLILTKQTAP